MPGWISDALCRATTGSGFSKRALYTDDDDVIYDIQRPVGINSINIAARKPDLLDRSIIIGLESIPDDKRRTIQSIRTEFEKSKAAILGGILDTVVKVLQMPEPRFERTFRMADFVSWGYRIAEALGEGNGKKLLAAYDGNVRSQAEEAVRADILSEVLLDYVNASNDKKFEGTATQLLTALRQKADELHISTRQREWPKSSNALSRRLKLLKDPLTRIGYTIDFTRDADGTRKLAIARVSTINTDEPSKNLSKFKSEPGKLSQHIARSSDRQESLDEIPSVDDTDDTNDALQTFPNNDPPQECNREADEGNE
jgi:hypothetical protein